MKCMYIRIVYNVLNGRDGIKSENPSIGFLSIYLFDCHSIPVCMRNRRKYVLNDPNSTQRANMTYVMIP